MTDQILDAAQDIDAMVTLANAASARGNDADAVALLSRAARADPANVEILVHLGRAYRKAERLDAARYVLERAVRLAAGRHAVARLTLASVLELDRRPDLALLHYVLALHESRRSTVAERATPEAAALAKHAADYVAAGRLRWFEQALARGGGAGAGDRVRQALLDFLGAMAVRVDPHPPTALFPLPGLDTLPLLDATDFPWTAPAAASLDSCALEIEACVAAARVERVSVLQRGVVQYEARKHAPRLVQALTEWPLAQVAHHAPDVDIVALAAGGRLAPQFGRSNSRCWVIFNAAQSADLAIGVGGEKRVLPAGAQAAVDPSFGVEFANVGSSPTRALVAEVWHPRVTEQERAALAELIAAAMDFEMRLQDLV